MCCSGKESIVYDESSSDSNDSTNQCSDDLNMLHLLASVAEEVSFDRLDDLNMLYLLASVAEEVSFDRLHYLTTADEYLREMPKCDVQTNGEIPTVQGNCEERRLFRQKCPFCCWCFSRKENLRWHIKRHAQGNFPEDDTLPTFSPSLLPDSAPEQEENRLISVVPDSCGFWCVKCQRNFQREATFRVHMRFHARKRSPFTLPLPCKKCAELCTTKTHYLIHKKMHRMEKIFSRRFRLANQL